MAKPFSSIGNQIGILRDRNLKIPDDKLDLVEHILKTENYYNIVNGYKCIFLDDELTSIENDDRYKKDTSFFEIYEVFLFDREIRNLFLRSLLIFESHFKSVVSYRFSEQFKSQDSYLDEENFVKDTNRLADIKKLIRKTKEIIDDKKEKDGHSINHYYDKHSGHIPLWVLVNDYTFGNISIFFSLLDDRLRNKIAKDFSEIYKYEYSTNVRVSSKILMGISKTGTHFRNCCAHEMTLYNASLKQRSATKEISSELNVEEKYLQKNGLFSLYIQLKLVLPKKEFTFLKTSLMDLLGELEKAINENAYKTITGIMGFPSNWDTVI
ncbi:Abi family protein [Enterococcus asini]|uniref:Abi family protein n=1 Tax=Enterococcus asini TaxID=57732 RepID=UPI00288DACB3|nr:Abi family protein [Enterococcus asini]MDT2744328.1 Abi family protein [Enterococcus asini]